MVFDFTNSNTWEIQRCACMTFQKRLGKPIFWLACRHHVLELLLNKVFIYLAIEKSKTPEIKDFKRFKNHWQKILQHLGGNFVLNLEVTSEIRQKYKKFQLPCLCDDYKEVFKLALTYIGLQSSQGFTPQRPGAVFRAKWMIKVIYVLKIVLLSQQN